MSKKSRRKQNQEPILEPLKNSNGIKLLIVDDDSRVTDLLRKLLIVDGYNPIIENDSSQAVEVALRELPNLICLDLMMAQPDGFRLCRMLRDIPEFYRTPILIITGLDDGDSRAVAFGAGANDYLTKPFHPGELDEKIRDLLHGSELGLYE